MTRNEKQAAHEAAIEAWHRLLCAEDRAFAAQDAVERLPSEINRQREVEEFRFLEECRRDYAAKKALAPYC